MEEQPQPRGIDNGKSSSERIIPITVLDCKHNNDENDNTSTSTTTGMSNVSKCPEKMSRIFAQKNVPFLIQNAAHSGTVVPRFIFSSLLDT